MCCLCCVHHPLHQSSACTYVRISPPAETSVSRITEYICVCVHLCVCVHVCVHVRHPHQGVVPAGIEASRTMMCVPICTRTYTPVPPPHQERFVRAMKLVGGEFVDRVTAAKDIWLPARELVEAAMDKRSSVISGWSLWAVCHEEWNLSLADHWETFCNLSSRP